MDEEKMNRNKSIKNFIAIGLVVLSLFVLSVSAHPGRTDSSGGHLNHSTGEYHYHHGYSAHQHTNGECPYDFKDATDHSHNVTNTPSKSNSNIKDGIDYVKEIIRFLGVLTLPLIFLWVLISIWLEKLIHKLWSRISDKTINWISLVITIIIGILVSILLVEWIS
jgi:tetrahydromethanopterin S-methyltransferase subunit E